MAVGGENIPPLTPFGEVAAGIRGGLGVVGLDASCRATVAAEGEYGGAMA
jgi:hypothetical protein